MSDDESRVAREVAARAIRRLEVLEWLMMGAAVVFSLLAGALVAWLLAELAGLGFRPTWVVASILLFVVPAALVYGRDRREERRRREGEAGPGGAPAGRRTNDLNSSGRSG